MIVLSGLTTFTSSSRKFLGYATVVILIVVICVLSGLERLDTLDELSVITDNQSFSIDAVNTDDISTSELLVVTSKEAGSLSSSNAKPDQGTHETGAPSTSLLRNQMYVF